MYKKLCILVLVLFSFTNCAQKPQEKKHEFTNSLIKETSPYLLQHAHNPVNWEAWRPEVLERAKKENKLLLISIGYAACHWCHVMEKECFEDKEVAQVMNDNFINIKIDREERPDIDQIYMDALQMMTGSGGWPLNIIALPDGRPFWGATYMEKDEWTGILNRLLDLQKNQPEKILEIAENLSEGIRSVNLIEPNNSEDIFNLEMINTAVETWSAQFDTKLGGTVETQKFMMPVKLDFLMHYAKESNNKDIQSYVNTSLTRMAWGGIFDQVGGGFSRYSVDPKWHIPHFEKMLYDNSQLISLYAKAYAATKNDLYKNVVQKTIGFVNSDLKDKSGGYYSSLDADSTNDEGVLEEGAYYIWTQEQLQALLKDDYALFKDFYNVNDYGLWEHGNYVLIQNEHNEEIAKRNGIELDELNNRISNCLQILKAERQNRSKPRLDDKVLTSLNGLMLKGLVDAYRYLEEDEYLDMAVTNANFITTSMFRKDGGLYRNMENNINGYLEDYATVIEAFISLYEVTHNEQWLNQAQNLVNYCKTHFYDDESGMFFFTSKKDDFVIRRTIETYDKEIPASNSIMAHNLYKLSKLYPDDGYEDLAKQMVKNVQQNLNEGAQYYANWMQLALFMNHPFYEVAVVGDDYKKKSKELLKHYIPNSVLAATKQTSDISILQERHSEGNTLIYVCIHGSCKLPQTEVSESLLQME